MTPEQKAYRIDRAIDFLARHTGLRLLIPLTKEQRNRHKRKARGLYENNRNSRKPPTR